MNGVLAFLLALFAVLLLGAVVETVLALWRWRRSGRWRWPMTMAGGLAVAGVAANAAAFYWGGRPMPTTEDHRPDVLALGREAEYHFSRGHYDTAVALCDRMNAAQPNCALAYHVRGLVYEARGRRDDALNQYHAAARLDFVPAVARLRRFGQ